MTWISIETALPNDGDTVFIRYLSDGDELFAESEYDGSFGQPYYGQDMVFDFDNVTHWLKPEFND